MSTSNDNKKGTSRATSTSKPEIRQDRAPGSQKGMEQKEMKKPEASSKPNQPVAKNDKGNEIKNIKNTKKN